MAKQPGAFELLDSELEKAVGGVSAAPTPIVVGHYYIDPAQTGDKETVYLAAHDLGVSYAYHFETYTRSRRSGSVVLGEATVSGASFVEISKPDWI